MIATGLAAGLLAVCFASTAAAEPTQVNNCTAVTNVVCVGQINNNPTVVNIGDVTVLSGNQLSVLSNLLNNAFVSVANISDINILSADLLASVQTAVNSWVTTTLNTVNTVQTSTKTCTVFVTPPAATTGMSAITVGCA
jgi:hypothetical protein